MLYATYVCVQKSKLNRQKDTYRKHRENSTNGIYVKLYLEIEHLIVVQKLYEFNLVLVQWMLTRFLVETLFPLVICMPIAADMECNKIPWYYSRMSRSNIIISYVSLLHISCAEKITTIFMLVCSGLYCSPLFKSERHWLTSQKKSVYLFVWFNYMSFSICFLRTIISYNYYLYIYM